MSPAVRIFVTLVHAILGCAAPRAQPKADALPIIVPPIADAAPTSSATTSAAPADAGRASCDDGGDLDACVVHALALRAGGPDSDRARNVEALALLERACAKDHARGCEGVAEMLQDYQYYRGTRDDAEACVVAWDRACRLRNLHACYRLGFYYTEWLTRDLAVDASGRVRKYRRKEDHARGIEWMRSACNAGIVESCEHLKDALGP